MDGDFIAKELNRNIDVFKNLLTDLPEAFYLWKQKPGKWCLLEIICHLYDEEREDFRDRVMHILENPELPMNPINPQGWVLERNYIRQDYCKMLVMFLNEREYSVEWLINLDSQNLDNIHKHPELGDMSAKMVLANWLAHDYLHIRQIIRLKYDYINYITGENLSYAGDW
jgi:hypothetical protein